MLFSCENDIEEVKQFAQQKLLPVNSSRNVELLYSDSAKLVLKLTAPRVDRYATDTVYDEFPEGVKFTFYNKLGKPESQVTANYAIHYISSKLMEAKNDVVVINKKGERLNTEHLIWNMAEQKIVSDVFVKIQTGDEIIYGEGLEAKQDFSQYKILKIKGVIAIEDETGESK